MKSLLTAVTIVAALCVVSIAAPPQREPTTSPATAALEETPAQLSESHRRLLGEYLKAVEAGSRSMSKADLKAAIIEAKAEAEWRRAQRKLQEAADILAPLNVEYQGTEQARNALRVLIALKELGITSDKVDRVHVLLLEDNSVSRPQTP